MARSTCGAIASATTGGSRPGPVARLRVVAGARPPEALAAAWNGSTRAEERVVFGKTGLLNFWPLDFSTGTMRRIGAAGAGVVAVKKRSFAFFRRSRNGMFMRL